MNKKRFWITAAALAAVLLIALLAWGNWALTVSEYVVTDGEIPQAFSGFRIVQVSDLHNTEFGTDNGKLLELVKEAEPDIIVITGDMVDSRRTDLQVALSFAQQAARIAPCYYVPGNHESRIAQYGKLKAGLEEAGVVVLENERVTLTAGESSVALLGVMDPTFSGAYVEKDTAPVMAGNLDGLGCGTEEYEILLAHRPELFEVYAEKGAELVLCGHVHGGQIRLPFVGGLYTPGQGLFPEYDAGVFTKDGTTMIVSRGLGNSLFPLRVNNPPELVVVRLKRE